ncbi:hypothetical protein N7470_000650 [Penicillium chermesinum]|nr:hypothetical protein N7470_000650 [Penicillium chermesinum]
MYFAFDVMGLVGFSQDFRQLEDGAEQEAIKELHQQMLFLGILKPAPWILTILGSIQGLVGEYGHDTTGVTLAHALFYLASNIDAYRKLQKELDHTFGDGAEASQFTNKNLQSLAYLEAVIHETLRLKPAVPSGQPRVTPSEGLQVDEVWIPSKTIVVVPQYVIQRDERYFPSGSRFIPERWLDEKDDLVKHEEAFFPFQLGQYSCVGKQLALMQLRSVISRIAYNFDLAFAAGEDGTAFDGDAKDTFTFTIGPLSLVFTERARQ